MHVGLRDKMGIGRRELWLEWDGKPLFYGWCAASVLPSLEVGSIWHPEKPFGTFLIVGRR
jgi:hypothetical protein